MVKLPDSWSVEEKISHLQRRILVYSYQYYEIGDTVVDDSFYDSCVKQLLMLKDGYPEEYRRSFYYYYYYAYEDFTGETGFYLYYRLRTEHAKIIKAIAYSSVDSYNRVNGIKSVN